MKFKKMMLVTVVLLAIMTIGAVSASDDVVSDELAVSDEGVDLQLPQENLGDDLLQDGEVNPDGSSYVTFNTHVMSSTGPKVLPQPAAKKLVQGQTSTVKKTTLDGYITSSYNNVVYDDVKYVFNHWEYANGTVIDSDQRFTANGTNYTVDFCAIYDTYPNCHITAAFNYMKPTGLTTDNESNSVGYGSSWGIGKAKFNNKVANYQQVTYNGTQYVFNHWEYENGTTVDTTKTTYLYWAPEDYTENFYARYDIYEPCTVTAIFNKMTSEGPVNITNQQTISYGSTGSISKGTFTSNAYPTEFNYDNKHYIFNHWEDADGNTVGESTYNNIRWAENDYNITFTAVYDIFDSCNITAFWNVMTSNGAMTTNQSNVVDYGNSWTISKSTFDNKAMPNEFDYQGTHYVFDHWEDDDGRTAGGNVNLYWEEEDYEVTYTAFYQTYPECTVTVIWNMESSNGPVTSEETYAVGYDKTKTISASTFSSKIAPYSEFDYEGDHYIFSNWEDASGNPIGGNQELYWEETDYTVNYYAVYDTYPECNVEVVWDMMSSNGQVTSDETYTINYDDFYTISESKFNSKIAPYTEFDYDGYHYVFDHWENEDGDTVSGNQEIVWAEEDYTVYYYAMYETSLLTIDTEFIFDDATLTYGDNPVLEVTLIDAEGNPVNNARIEVTNSLGNYKYNTDANGVINVPIKQKPGEHEFTFTYAGNKDYNPAYATKIVILNKMATEISVADVSMNYKEDADYEITVTDANGNPISGVTVNVNNGAKTLKYRTDSNGVATAPITLKPGTYTFTVSFDGNALYEPSSASSTVTVNKAEVTIDADDMECTYNDGSSFDAMLYDINANAISGVTVKFDNGVKVLRYHTNEYGVASAPITLKPGVYTYTISFDGNSIYAPASVTKTLTVNKAIVNLESADTEIEYKNGNLTAKLTGPDGKAISGATIKFTQGSSTYRYHTDANGVATAPINLKPGTYTYTISYDGNSLNGPAETTAVVKVNKLDAFLTANDITMKFKDGTNYTAKVTDADGNPLAGVVVKVNRTGNTYKYKTDAQGMISVPLNFKVGTYDFVAFIDDDMYNPVSVATTVTITK